MIWLAVGAAEPRYALSRADEAFQGGRLAEAEALYEQLAVYPGGRRSMARRLAEVRLARARLDTNDPHRAYARARDAWLDVHDHDDQDSTSYAALAEAYLAMGDVEQAEEILNQMPAGNGVTTWLQEIASAHLEQGNWEAAGRAYARVAAAEPGNSDADYWAGALLLAADPSRATQHLHQAQRNPLLSGRAERLLQAQERVAGSYDPAYRAAQLGLGYLDIGEPGLAEAQFLVAVDHTASFADAWAYLGTARDQLGRDGQDAIARAIDLEPDRPLFHSLMGHHWLGLGRPDLARQEFTAAQALDPDFPAHLAEVALTYQLERDLSSAEAWYQAAIGRAPDAPTFWALLAQFYLDTMGKVVDGGLLVAQKAVALDPEDPAALDILGWAQSLSGQGRLAEVNLLASRQRDPARPSVHYHLGRHYEDQGDDFAAAEAYRLAVALDTTCRACPAARQGTYAVLAACALVTLGFSE